MTDDIDDPNHPDYYPPGHIEVASIDDETGLNILIRNKVALTISWKQAQSLNTLICVELDHWLHRQGKWSIQITKAGPVDLPAGQADVFADSVIEGAGLDDEAADEIRPALTDWFDRWSIEDDSSDTQADPQPQPAPVTRIRAMANEDEYVYVENRVERAWNIPVDAAQQLLDMPDATAEEMAAKLNSAFDFEDGADESLLDRFNYPEDNDLVHRFLDESVTGTRAGAITPSLEQASADRAKAGSAEYDKIEEISGHVRKALQDALYKRELDEYAELGSSGSYLSATAAQMDEIADEVIAQVGPDQLKPAVLALVLQTLHGPCTHPRR